jgi:uncharacterized membrane protein YphA (DoxX/SURF4 family)
MTTIQRAFASTAPKATVLIRALFGRVFLSEGIQKFLFPESLGTGASGKGFSGVCLARQERERSHRQIRGIHFPVCVPG